MEITPNEYEEKMNQFIEEIRYEADRIDSLCYELTNFINYAGIYEGKTRELIEQVTENIFAINQEYKEKIRSEFDKYTRLYKDYFDRFYGGPTVIRIVRRNPETGLVYEEYVNPATGMPYEDEIID